MAKPTQQVTRVLMDADRPVRSATRHGTLANLDKESLRQAAECLRTLAHPHRLQIIQLLLEGRYTVGELARACGIASHVASEHLRLMQHCGFLTSQREGRRIYYAVQEPHLAELMRCLQSRFGKRSAG